MSSEKRKFHNIGTKFSKGILEFIVFAEQQVTLEFEAPMMMQNSAVFMP
jgi:hypothetical protein